jgi:D-aminoacyl-tRNA deacylase
MKLIIQRVKQASVEIDKKEFSRIGPGYLILFGVKEGDTEKEVQLLAEKTVNLRVMSDEQDKMNRSILDVDGSILVVSQFTLYADTTGGRRPSFIQAAKPEIANKLYELFIQKLKDLGVKNVQTGKFGTYMFVSLVNDGPVTIIIDIESQINNR